MGHYGDVRRTSYFNVQRTSVEDVLRMSAGDVPWRYIEDHMGTSIGRLLGTSSGHPRDVILPSGRTFLVSLCFLIDRTWKQVLSIQAIRPIIGQLNVSAATTENEEQYTSSNITYTGFQNSYTFLWSFLWLAVVLKRQTN